MLGISNRAVSKWESGISNPSTENLIKLSQVFGVPIDFFINKSSETKEKICGMESLTELYKIGRGPSSSHTIGPERACMVFKRKNSSADCFKAVLYGSLAKTGKGHGSDCVIKKTFMPKKCIVEFDYSKKDFLHPNTMELFAYKHGEKIDFSRVYSVGGGRIVFDDQPKLYSDIVYNIHSFREIADYCEKKQIRLWEFAVEFEDNSFGQY